MKNLVKYKLIVILYLMFLSSYIAHTEDRAYISPGLKIGYEFGDNGGFTFGFELSYVMELRLPPFYGIVLNYDFLGDKHKILVGVEALSFPPLMGITVGPSIVIDRDNNIFYGGSVIPFFGLYGYFYFESSFYFDHELIEQAGLYLKYPIRIEGSPYTL